MQYQAKSIIRRCCQSIGPVVEPLPPLLLSPIPLTCRLSSSNTYVVIANVLVLIFLCQILRHSCIYIGPIVNIPPHPLSYSIHHMRRLLLILRWSLRRCRWVLGPVLLRRRHLYRQFTGPINTLPHLLSETFTWSRHLVCFLHQHLRCHHRVLRIIFLCQRLRHCRQFLRPVIATPHPLLSFLNPQPSLLLSLIPQTRRLFLVIRRRLRHCRWVLGTTFFHRRRRGRQFTVLVITPPPLPLETFTQARCLFCFLHQHLNLCQVLGPIFLYRHLRCYRQLLRPVIATPQPQLSSLNTWARLPFYILHRLPWSCCWFLGLIFLRWRPCCYRWFCKPVSVTPPTQS